MVALKMWPAEDAFLSPRQAEIAQLVVESHIAAILTTGFSDRRTAPWQVAKMAARLQASTTSGKPTLLRADAQVMDWCKMRRRTTSTPTSGCSCCRNSANPASNRCNGPA